MGLGTSKTGEANRLLSELNEILSNSAFWEASARSRAEQQFDKKGVDIFYHGLAIEVVDYVEESISAAVLTAYYKATDAEILRRLLHHVSQRFRLNYILGNGDGAPNEADIDDEDEGTVESTSAEAIALDLDETNTLLK